MNACSWHIPFTRNKEWERKIKQKEGCTDEMKNKEEKERER
jgi:hypothetical protein